MDIGQTLLLLGGLAVLAFSLWCRAGRSRVARWWRGSETSERAVLLVFPGLSVVLLAAGLLPLTDDGSEVRVLLGLAVLAGLAVATWGGLALPVPRWYVPGWVRPEHDRRRQEQRSRKAARRRR